MDEVEPFRLTDAPVPGFPDFRTTGSRMVQLDRLPARWTVSGITVPEEVRKVTNEFVLPFSELKRKAATLRVFRAPLPFPIELDEQTFKPKDMIVVVDGVALPFSRGGAAAAKKPSWRVNQQNLLVSMAEEPTEVKVIYEGVVETLTRHDPTVAAEKGDAFHRYSMTIRRETRAGLLLVAPTVGEWDIEVPPTSATFETWLALERPPLDEPASDGATFSVSVTADGATTELTTVQLEAPSTGYQQVTADLTPWAGKKVTIRLASAPGEDSTFDWVFAGSPTIWGPPGGDVRRIVVVALDTTRPDHLSFFGYERPTTPEIDAWASTGVVFDRTWSTAPRTRPSFRSSTTGRLPLDAVQATNLAEVFTDHGFATAGYVANLHLQPRFYFDKGYDSWLFDGAANATQQVDRAIGWLQDHAEVDSYLFVHFMDPHMVYSAPEPYGQRFVTVTDPTLPDRVKRQDVVTLMHQQRLSEEAKKQIVAQHDGELAYTSAELQRLFTAVDQLPGKSLVVLHSDHGEEFWEHQGFEHNHTLFDEVTRVVFAMRPSGGLPEGRRYDTPVSLIDLAPTLYDLFGVEEPPAVDGRTLVPLLAGQTISPRALPVAYIQYTHERWGVVWNEHKYLLHTGSGKEELFDLKKDPKEQVDVSATADLGPYRSKLGQAHHIVVGPGFRVRVDLPPASAGGPPMDLVLRLPAPAKHAGVLDPESIVEKRANVEWGETPKKFAVEVGAVTVREGGQEVVFTPGTSPEGIVYVVFAEPQDPAAVKATLGGTPIELLAQAGPNVDADALQWKEKSFSVVVDPGTVVIPPETEAARMGMGSSSEHDELCKLGYIQGDECGNTITQPRDLDDEPAGGEPDGDH